MENDGQNIVQLRPLTIVQYKQERPSIASDVVSTIKRGVTKLISGPSTLNENKQIEEMFEKILKKNGCVLQLSNELFEEIQEHLDDVHSCQKEMASVPRVIFNTLWSYCPKFISGKKLCELLREEGVEICGTSDIKVLAKTINSDFIVPKIIGFQSVFDSEEMSFVFCETKEPIYAKYARILHRNAVS
ncbi:MAG: hypothetical protein RBS56_01035 [Candidatus Gracilibacteria bacterium]|jgi:hypothetical protein|nr:hypothetical protein [Candidatus Gracilibacteria bacterium]